MVWSSGKPQWNLGATWGQRFFDNNHGFPKELETAVLRLPLHQDHAPGIESFLHFWEMHDQVLLDFPAYMETGAAGRFDQSFGVPVQPQDVPVIIDQGIGGMSDHEQLAPEAVQSEQIFQQGHKPQNY